MALKSKHLLGIKELTASEINLILDTAEAMKEVLSRPMRTVPALQGKMITNLFYEPSTRTRTSFETAAKHLSASVGSVAASSSSIVKGESLVDTAKNLEALGVNAIVVRHSMSGAPHLIAKNISGSVINAGDGCNEHPTQALLDIFTMREKKGSLKGKKVVIVGDILHSRVARSNMWGLLKMGAAVSVVGPPTLMPKGLEETGVKVSFDLKSEIKDADFINILRIQLERQKDSLFPSLQEYADLFGLNSEMLKNARKDVVILHPGPINRGVEMTSEIADGPYNVILEQVTNGVAVRMAVLFLLLGSGKHRPL
ncbi:MAG: aspartate carbamoyltransferase catalytic subunit [Candidatus Margulisiibacteriota bacterium]